MNKIHRVVWNELTRTWVAVAEIVKARGKAASAVVGNGAARQWSPRPLALSLALIGVGVSAAPPAPNQLPTGGHVVAGQASIGQSGNTMTITQTSQRAVLDWTTFNVGGAATVNFDQRMGATSVTLNRVLDSNPMQIYGRITAPGQVFFTNPGGAYFAPGASVEVGSLGVTTHSIDAADFMAGNYRFTRKGATGSIVNEGNLKAGLGGYIALLAPEVRNNGVIVARMGTIILAAGETFELQFDGGRLASIRVQPATIAALVENKNAVLAPGGLVILSAQAANRLQGGVVNNSGRIEATGLANNGGTVRLEASDRITHTGSINVDAAAGKAGAGGTALLITTLTNKDGVTEVNGTISAKGGDLGGNGGFVETSAANLRIGADARVGTAAKMGLTGTWLLDPTNFTISSGTATQTSSGIGATTLQNNLAGSNVSISTSASGSEAGDINVNAPVWWNANKLTLTAHGDVNVNAPMTMTGTSQLDVTTGASGRFAMGFDTGGIFKGRIDLPGRSGTYLADGTTPILRINNENYAIINSLGNQGSTTGTDLQGMAGNLSGKFALGTDINASAASTWNTNAGFAPIGNFAGGFDGLGHTINGLTINSPSTDGIGLFAAVTSTGEIRNVGLVGANITGRKFVGALAGTLEGTAYNVFATGGVAASASSGYGWAGGLVGYGKNATISNAYANATATGYQRIGGLVGYQKGGSIKSSYANGKVTASQYAGGLAGYGDTNAAFDNIHASGAVVASGSYVGGLIGYGRDITLTNAYATGKVTMTGSGGGAGGLLGGLGGASSLTNAFATGDVTASSMPGVGGLIGNSYTSGAISNVFATGNIDGADLNNGGGGLIGNLGNSSGIGNAYATGTVNGQAMDGATYKVIGSNSGVPVANVLFQAPSLTDNTWTGAAGDGKWTTAGNWSLNHAPTIFEKAILAGNTVGIPSIVMTGDISATAGSKINFTGALVSSLSIGGATPSAVTTTVDYGTSGKINLPSASTWNYNGTIYNVIKSLGTTTDHDTSGNYTLQGMGYYSGSSGPNMLNKNYIFGMDIDASATSTWNIGDTTYGEYFRPIGSRWSQNFTGSLDGLGHSVVNLNVKRTAASNGLFSTVNNSNLSNFGLVGGSIEGTSSTAGIVGVAAMTSATAWSNLWVANTSIKGQGTVGGILGSAAVGTQLLNLSRLHASGTVDATSGSGGGGLAGLLKFANLTDSYFNGTVTSSGWKLGGLVGEGQGIQLTRTWATGSVMSSGSTVESIGGLIGYGKSVSTQQALVIQDSFSSSTVSGKTKVGGLVGSFKGANVAGSNLRNVRTHGAVTGGALTSQGSIGGLIGYMDATSANYQMSLTGAIATGGVTGSGTGIGGLIGYGKYVTITDTGGKVMAFGSVSAVSQAGGLAGWMSDGNVSGAAAYGNVTSNNGTSVGGLIGSARNLNIASSKATGNVTSTNTSVGGLVGSWAASAGTTVTIGNSSASGTIQGGDRTGGLIGSIGQTGTYAINTTYATGDVTGNNYVGGLVGVGGMTLGVVNNVNNFSALSITDSYASGGSVTGVAQVGGLVGGDYLIPTFSAPLASTITLLRSYSLHNVTASGNDVGGLIGYANKLSADQVFATGNVGGNTTTSANVGGLIGRVGDTTGQTLTNAFAAGSVNGANKVAGLIGALGSGTLTVTHVYARGAVAGSGTPAVKGGLIADAGGGTLTMSDSYWDNQTSGQSASAGSGAAGKPTAEMTAKATYAGFDMNTAQSPTVWRIQSASNASYPHLCFYVGACASNNGSGTAASGGGGGNGGGGTGSGGGTTTTTPAPPPRPSCRRPCRRPQRHHRR